MAFEVVVLGSGTAVPRAHRAPSCHLLDSDDHRILLDCGAAAPLRLADAGCDVSDLDAVAVTHLHIDHCAGLVPLFQGMWAHPAFRRRRRLTLAGPRRLSAVLDHCAAAWGAVGAARAGLVDFRAWEDDGPLLLGPFVITPFPVAHTDDSVALRVDGPGGTLVYSGDCDRAADLAAAAAGADVLVAACARPAAVDFPAHPSASDLAWVAREAGVRRVVLVHLYPDVDPEDARRTVGSVVEVDLATDLSRYRVG